MATEGSKVAYALAAGAGAVLWITTAIIGGRTEPWDSPGYWSVAYPLAIVLSGVLGYLFTRAPWRWAVTLMFMQAPVMVFGGAGFGLLPLGLIVLAVLSLPAVALASFAAKVRLGIESD
jgi:hypothetical protein